jgi:hypothetical protein
MSELKLEEILEGESFPENNRYLVFAGDSHYPQGGWSDLVYSSNLLDDVMENLFKLYKKNDWFQIVDIKLNKIVIDSSQAEIESDLVLLFKNCILQKINSSNQ